MASSNIAVTHSDSGVVVGEVVDAARISPNVVRVTIGGDQLRSWRHLGFDQWFRLALPSADHTRYDNLADTFGLAGYLKYLTLPRATRPMIRNYTVREFRPADLELDVDFVVHGSGIAGPWAASLPLGAPVGLIDQGCGFVQRDAAYTLLIGDESALPAVAGILRDLPRDARGHALVELADLDDRQQVDAPAGFEMHWIVRRAGEPAGRGTIDHLRALSLPSGSVNAFAAGESKLATGVRRHLVNDRGVPKGNVTFCGYWRAH